MLMNEQWQDAIDINDFVYAATGARVRRLTLPDGRHWFPAADVARELGHTNASEALRRHVPEDMRTPLETLISREGWLVPPGQGLKKSMTMLSLGGLIRLVNGCVKRECEPFKNWITEVVVKVQREGTYTLEKAEVQPREADGPTAYAMPAAVADAIVRLEEHNLRMDEEWLAQRREERRFESGVTAAHQEMLAQHQEMLAQHREIIGLLGRLVENTDPGHREVHSAPAPAPQRSAGAVSLLSLWERNQLAITKDVWPVAALMAGMLTVHGEARVCMEEVVGRTGLPQEKVLAALRLLLRHNCVRQRGVDPEGAHVYVLPGA
ncbi:DNA-binding protein [Streptomyces diacarni]|uniref:DNA-binding protein n=2 Tax=Streptomyces diacarni TaxID=2800381 RepID=A0A367E7H1_9ACTN|nr:DNA-binding protein [Streptomyces diacarni]